MSKILEEIKKDQKRFRISAVKDKNELAKEKATVLTTLMGELETKEKRTGEAIVDSDVVSIIKSSLDSIQLNVDKAKEMGRELDDTLEVHRITLEHYLPKQLTREELAPIVQSIVAEVGAESMRDMGKVMAKLKADHGGLFDGGMASQLVKESINA